MPRAVPAVLVTVIAVADAVLAERVVLLGLLAVPPLVAAATDGPEATAFAGLSAVVAAIALGPVDHIWGTVDHLTRCVALVVVSALAVWLAFRRKAADAAAVELAEARQEQPAALELNDTVVQGLASAKLAFEIGDTETAHRLLGQTLTASRRLVDDMLRDSQPGDLRRQEPATLDD